MKGVAADDVTEVLVVEVLATVVMLAAAVSRSSLDTTDALTETNMVAAAGVGIVLTALEEVGMPSAIPVAGNASEVVAMTTGAT